MTAPPATDGTNNEELGEEYEVEIVSPQEHTGSGFCWDPTCPDKEDQELIQTLGEAVQDGLVTTQEADNIYRGKTVLEIRRGKYLFVWSHHKSTAWVSLP